MAPRRSTKAGNIHVERRKLLDSAPAEIANGVFLPATSLQARARFGQYQLELVVTIKDRQPRCEVLTIRNAAGSAAPVTATVLREIPVAAIVEQIMLGVFGSPFRLEGQKRVPISTQSAIVDREGRPPRRELMPKVVQAYRDALANPATRSKPILAAPANLGGDPLYSPKYISKLISEARRDPQWGLGPTSPGVPGEQKSEGSK